MSLPNASSPQILREAIIVFLRHPTPWMLIGFSAVTAAIRVLLGPIGFDDLIVAAIVVVFWPLSEWLIHVFILHWKPIRIFGRTIDLLVAKKHRDHHADPYRIDLVFIPIHIIPLAWLGALVGWNLLAPTHALAFTGLLSAAVLSVHYEWVHYLVHTRYRPRSSFYGRLWRNHRLHHFMNEHYWYGVTMLSGDRTLGTAPEHSSVVPSETCRTLGRTNEIVSARSPA